MKKNFTHVTTSTTMDDFHRVIDLLRSRRGAICSRRRRRASGSRTNHERVENLRGTIAMARTNPDTATGVLYQRGEHAKLTAATARRVAAPGRVIEGMDVGPHPQGDDDAGQG